MYSWLSNWLGRVDSCASLLCVGARLGICPGITDCAVKRNARLSWFYYLCSSFELQSLAQAKRKVKSEAR
jgi:hypothetical protein